MLDINDLLAPESYEVLWDYCLERNIIAPAYSPSSVKYSWRQSASSSDFSVRTRVFLSYVMAAKFSSSRMSNSGTNRCSFIIGWSVEVIMSDLLYSLMTPECTEVLWDYCLENNLISPGIDVPKIFESRCSYNDGRFSVSGEHGVNRVSINVWINPPRSGDVYGAIWSVGAWNDYYPRACSYILYKP